MHGLQGQKRIAEAEYKFYDAVIPSGFDLSEFEFRDKKDDYFLMCGRIVWSKGVDIAAQVCEKLGVKLILAGTSYGPKDCNLGDKWPDHVSYVGYADVEKRKRLMAGAKGLFCPTIYNEPFGYVAIEAMLSGTPVITVDWGAFTETVQHGVTGYRCRTFEQFLWAAKNIHTISPWACREWAVKNYSFEKVGKMYKEYFQSLQNLTSKGWYTENENRKELEWLTKEQPQQPKTFDNILRLLNSNHNGNIKFIQIGAMDGVKFDDLYLYIRNFNWSGYLVEPLPEKFEKLMNNYQDVEGLSFECSAITNFDGEVEIYTVPQEKIDDGSVEEWAEGCSTLTPKTHLEGLTPHMVPKLVNAMTFDTFSKKWSIENSDIDFIQVDTEGSDYDIMMQIMNSGVRPKLFKIEIAHITYNKAVYVRWLLEKENYKTFIDGYDLVAYRL
jgi:FkbM family methyltransferase